jgi:hypothetical protein
MESKKIKSIFFGTVLIVIFFGFCPKVFADYETSGILQSTNLLVGTNGAASIDSFTYTISDIPENTTIQINFSEDFSGWHSASGVPGGWTTLSVGTHTIDLSGYAWQGHFFAYQIYMTSDGTDTPVLDSVEFNYTPYDENRGVYTLDYETSGNFISVNLLDGASSVVSIDSFDYNLSALPDDTSGVIQFSQDQTNWYSSSGVLDGSSALSSGENTIDISGIGWSGSNFYYKITLTSDGTDTPILDEISLNYTTDTTAPTISYTGDTPDDDSTINQTSATIETTSSDNNSWHSVINNWNDSLVGWWRMNGDLTDSSGNGNDGTNHGATYTASGKLGGAYSFDGDDNYVSTDYNEEVKTLSFWMKTNDFDTLKGQFGQRYDSAEESGNWQMHWDDEGSHNKLRIYAYSDTSMSGWSTSANGGTTYGGEFVTTTTFETDTWYHVVVTSSGTLLQYYVNGAYDNQKANNFVLGGLSNDDDLIIGGSFGNENLYPFNGLIDDVMIFNRALSADEIASLYDASASQYSNTFTGLSDLTTYTYQTYAQDAGGNVATAGEQSFDIVLDSDAPVISAGLPTGEQEEKTEQVTMSVTTDENATCKYGTIADTAYASIANTFNTTGSTSHSQTLSNLEPNTNYTYYIRCIDAYSNANTSDYTVSFSIPALSGGQNDSGGYPSLEQNRIYHQITLNDTEYNDNVGGSGEDVVIEEEDVNDQILDRVEELDKNTFNITEAIKNTIIQTNEITEPLIIIPLSEGETLREEKIAQLFDENIIIDDEEQKQKILKKFFSEQEPQQPPEINLIDKSGLVIRDAVENALDDIEYLEMGVNNFLSATKSYTQNTASGIVSSIKGNSRKAKEKFSEAKEQFVNNIKKEEYNPQEDPRIPEELKDHKYEELHLYLTHTDGSPLAYANVTLFSEPKHSITDINGEAVFNDVHIGEHELAVSFGTFKGKQDLFIKESSPKIAVAVTVNAQSGVNSWVYVLSVVLGVILSVVFVYLIMKRKEEKVKTSHKI